MKLVSPPIVGRGADAEVRARDGQLGVRERQLVLLEVEDLALGQGPRGGVVQPADQVQALAQHDCAVELARELHGAEELEALRGHRVLPNFVRGKAAW